MPNMVSVIFLFVIFCFLYGLVLIVKQALNKEACVLSLPVLHWDCSRMSIAIFLFLFVPWSTQNIGMLLLKHIPNTVDKVLWLALLGELSLMLYILILLKKNTAIMQKISNVLGLFKDIFEGYCKCLPWLFLVTVFWKFVVDLLERWGLPVSFDQQLIIQLLAHFKPHLMSVLAIGVCVIILAPLCEEIFFRGIFLRFLHARMSLTKSLWICSFIFALVHQHFASLLPLCFLGYWLGYYYVKTGNLWTSIGIHALFNGTNLILVFVMPEL